jgi:prephenate dehydrogenase
VNSADEHGFRRVAIVGLGLMGGSLARALKNLPDPPHIRATSRDPRDVRAGLESGVVDEGGEGAEALLRERDLVVYATPLSATVALLGEHRSLIGPETVIVDVASLKGPVLARARALDLEGRYVGSHPMVGGAGAGFQHSREDLYRGAPVWVVSGPVVSADALIRVRAFWRRLGARPADIDAMEHDESMVWVSHLPQLASNALALTLEGRGIKRVHLGSGGRDMTRLAGSTPEMWEDLFEAAPPALPGAVDAFVAVLREVRQLLDEQNWKGIGKLMRETRNWSEEEP